MKAHRRPRARLGGPVSVRPERREDVGHQLPVERAKRVHHPHERRVVLGRPQRVRRLSVGRAHSGARR
eukprot:6172738-Pleurochrysis_carterae.AAC.1